MDALAAQRLKVRLALNQRDKDPLSWWSWGVPRLRDAFGLFSSPDPIDELHARACNKGTKTESGAAYILACLQKRKHLDGVPLPQWRGRVEGAQLVLDYPQQLLSVQPAYMRLLGQWPHHARYKGEILASLRIKPIDGNNDETTWSVIQFLSQKNLLSGTGVRGDIIGFDEPPVMSILRELRKASHAHRRCVTLIQETPTLRRQWSPLKEDYGDTPRRTLRRVDQERAEVRWSLDEVADWILSPAEKAKLRRKYATDPLRDAREHGDYIDTSGLCPFDMDIIAAMMEECTEPIEVVQWRISHEVPDAGRRVKKVATVPVQIWKHREPGKSYYIPIDPAAGTAGGHPLGLHVVEDGTGELVARYLGHHSPYVVGVLAAGLARQYGDAVVQPEINDGWGTAVLQALADCSYGNIGKDQNMFNGEVLEEPGFRTNQKTRPLMIAAVQQWINAWGAGVRYGRCPSTEVLANLLDIILDDNDKVVAMPGAHHGEDMILRGKGLLACCDHSGMDIPETDAPVRTPMGDMIRMIQGRDEDQDEEFLIPRQAPRI